MTGSPGPEAREAAGGIAGEVGLEQRDRNSDNNVRKGEGASSVRAEFSAQARDRSFLCTHKIRENPKCYVVV